MVVFSLTSFSAAKGENKLAWAKNWKVAQPQILVRSKWARAQKYKQLWTEYPVRARVKNRR
jgi:hypothetical protein